MKKNCFKKIVTIIVLTAIVFTMAVPTFAARPYKDVYKGQNVDSFTYQAIKYLKKHHAFDGVIKGKNFKPDKVIIVKECLKYLINLFGKKNVPITKWDRANYKKKFRMRWFIKKLEAVSKKMGGGAINWIPPLNYKVTRELAVHNIYGFLIYERKLKTIR